MQPSIFNTTTGPASHMHTWAKRYTCNVWPGNTLGALTRTLSRSHREECGRVLVSASLVAELISSHRAGWHLIPCCCFQMWKQPEVWQGLWPQIPDHVPLSPRSLLCIRAAERNTILDLWCYPFSQKCPLRWNLLVILTLIARYCYEVWLLLVFSSPLLSCPLLFHHSAF